MRKRASDNGSQFATPCGHDSARVADSRPIKEGTRRRRVCCTCQLRFTTIEMVAAEGHKLRILAGAANRAYACITEAARHMGPLLDLKIYDDEEAAAPSAEVQS